MDAGTWGLIGGIIGSVIGLIGGLTGAYFSIKNTNGPKERAFVIRATLGFLGVGGICVLIALLLPNPYKVLGFVPFWIFMPFAIRFWNKKQMMIRELEARKCETSAEK